MSNMANLNPAAYANGINLTNGIVSMPNTPRGLAHMHLAMGQAPPSLNPTMQQYSLGLPMLTNVQAINNPRLQGQRQIALAQNPSPPITRTPMSYFPRPQHSQGTCILRVFMFSDYLTNEHPNKKDINYWKRVVSEFFSEEGKIRYSLWNNLTNENRMFEIPNPVISRFFQVNFESGVTSIQLTMSSIKENCGPPIRVGENFTPPVSTVEATKASMIYNYEDGSRVVATGRLKVRFNHNIKIDIFEFNTEKHTEYVPRVINNMLPESPIGEYGIPTKTLRSLEVAEGVVTLNDLISTVINSNKGPLQALSALANPEQNPQNIINQSNNTPPTPGPSPPEIPAKTPKEKAENAATDNNTQSTTNDVPVPSPSTSNTIAKQESPSTKSLTKSPVSTSKRPSNDPSILQKPKQRRMTKTPQRKSSRQETGS